VRSTIWCLAVIAAGLAGIPRGAQAEELASLDTWDLSGEQVPERRPRRCRRLLIAGLRGRADF
jgi:hypothetical protein